MPRTTPIHTNCGTCTECAQNLQVVKYECEKGGSYSLLNGYVEKIDDVCIKPEIGIWWPTIIKCIIVGQIVGVVVFLISAIPIISAATCLGVSLITYLYNEHQ
jgi:hypothetical protein